MTAASLETVAAYLRDWAVERALPFWATRGFDREHGRFEERLTMDGQPIPAVPVRLIVQARQIYCFGLAARRGWYREAAKLAEIAFATMCREYHRRDGVDGWIFSVHRDGSVAESRRDLYAHAFVLLGVASYILATGRREALAVADETLEFLASAMRAPSGGYVDSIPSQNDVRCQNPHMHLLEGLLWLWSASGERRFLAQAEEIVDLFVSKFFQPRSGVLLEYFDAGLAPARGIAGQIVEPGHHFEWVWLLNWFERETGRAMGPFVEALYDHAARHGHATSGLVFDEILTNGSVHTPSHRVWPVTEAIKAHLAMAASLRPQAEAGAAAAADRLVSRFLTPQGGWIDRLDASGVAATDFMPASTLYHVMCAIDELGR